jgi:hypothetical protein
MLVIFRSGNIPLDVIGVLPREIEAHVRSNGLGKKEGHFFWVEVDTNELNDEQYKLLADELAQPILSEVPKITHPFKTNYKKYRVIEKRRNQLIEKRLQALDHNFDANIAVSTHEAKRIYPKRKLTIKQLRHIIKDKVTGKSLNGD